MRVSFTSWSKLIKISNTEHKSVRRKHDCFFIDDVSCCAESPNEFTGSVAVVIRHQLQEVAEITAISKASSTILLAMLFHSACDKSDIALQ